MKSSSSAAPRNSNTNHPPLARNAQGHPVAMPDGAVWWQLKREPRGRPSLIKGSDGHPVRLPLDTTEQEVLETWGAGTFRLDALDALGNVLDYVTTVEIRGDESGDDDESDVDARGVSDLRYTLQTLSQVTRANADAIRAVTEAQADWVKGLAANKSLPRHPMYLPAPGQAATHDREEDDEDDDGGHRNAGEPDGPPPPPAPTQPEWGDVGRHPSRCGVGACGREARFELGGTVWRIVRCTGHASAARGGVATCCCAAADTGSAEPDDPPHGDLRRADRGRARFPRGGARLI